MFVFICAAGHSGSTLLDLLLGAHPQGFSLGEITQLPKNISLDSVCSCNEKLSECAFWHPVVTEFGRSIDTDLWHDPYRLNLGFIKAAVKAWAGVSPVFVVLDTMQIEHRQRKRRDVPVKQGDMHLGKLRQEYGLPRYGAHNALNDAFATAELTLAIASRLEPEAPLGLKPYLRYY